MLEIEKAMQHYNIASKSRQAYINVRLSKGEVGGVGSWCAPYQSRTVLVRLGKTDWPWDSWWNMVNYVLKFFKASSPRKEYTFNFWGNVIFTFLCEAAELGFSLGISAFLYFVLLCLRQQQNSQERCDEDVLSTWKNGAVCCLSSWSIREKEPVNSPGATWLEGYSIHYRTLVSSVL